jgi:hydroxyethylthiazole kinase-like uncharacterized protein yjeF
MSTASPAIPPSHAVLTVAEMYAADKAAMAQGISGMTLMENAGRAVADVITARWRQQTVAVLCGPGNNGGDGFVVARLLADAGWPVRLALLGPPAQLRGDAAHPAALWKGEVLPLNPQALDGASLVVDAIFGAGLNRALSGEAEAVVLRINAEKRTCIAVDVPSGVHGDTGEVLGVAPRCVATVTFFRPKPAHLLYPARDLLGDLTVADIGIPDDVLIDIAPACARNAPGLWTIPTPQWNDHKYHRGHAMVVGDSLMNGAARLAGRAARRIGAGMLTYAVPQSVLAIYALDAAGAITQALDSQEDMAKLLADKRRNGVLIGPGLPNSPEMQMRIRQILAAGRAVVLDAGAVTNFEDNPEDLFRHITDFRRAGTTVVMTPHDGEFDRLFKGDAFKGDRIARARAAAKGSGAVVVLKGASTVVAAPDGRAALNANAPPWLATAGAGDVLAGFILGLMVQGMPAWEAAAAGVWLHGAAAAALGRGLIAEDLPEAVPKLLESL